MRTRLPAQLGCSIVTVPAPAAATGVPMGAARSWPVCSPEDHSAPPSPKPAESVQVPAASGTRSGPEPVVGTDVDVEVPVGVGAGAPQVPPVGAVRVVVAWLAVWGSVARRTPR